ncbi:MAG: hypothetical protein QXL88_00250 [Candidatus Pacearchaeota archaeon]
MKYPKIKIDWSFVLQESIIRSSYNEEKLKNFKKRIEKKLSRNLPLIFELLSKYTGLSWKRQEIFIWIFEGKHRSIPDPFLLNVYEYDIDFCMFELIHLLVHNIFQDNEIYFIRRGRIEETELEAFTYLIAKKIVEKLYSREKVIKLLKKAEEEGFRKYIFDRVDEIEKETNSKNEPIIKVIKKEMKTKSFSIFV